MSTYHCSIKHGSKGNGACAVAKHDYVSRVGKYADKQDHVYNESGNMPEWAQDNPRAFWEATDEHERANGRLYTEIDLALPRDYSLEEHKKMLDGLVEEHLKGHPYTLNIHNPPAAIDGEEQPHAHIIFSERKLDGIERDKEQFFMRANKTEPEKGGCAKDRTWNDRDKVQAVRESWEREHNKRVFDVDQISCKSLKDQGIDREPEQHLGPKKSRSLHADKIKEARASRKQLEAINREMQSLTKEIEPTPQDIVIEPQPPKTDYIPASEPKAEKIQEVAQTPVTTRPADRDQLQGEPVTTISSPSVAKPQSEALPLHEKNKPTPQQPASKPLVVEPSFDPDAQRRRLTEIDKAMSQIDQRYTPTPAEIEADNKTRFADLEGWKDEAKAIDAKTPDFDKRVQKWRKTGEEKDWSMDNTSILRSAAQKAWQEKGKELQAERDKLVAEKKYAVEQVKAWEKHIKENEGKELRQEAAKRRNADPEYQKLKIEQNAIKAAIREHKQHDKGKDMDKGRGR